MKKVSPGYQDQKPDVISVADYIALLNNRIRDLKARIVGEVSGVEKNARGHVFFALKDKGGTSVLRCVIWNSAYQSFGIDMENGMELVISGAPNVYPPSGYLKFIAQTIELYGEGELLKKYRKLKEKLTKEGLFAEERKRAIPEYIQKVGLITSVSGAVISDFSNNLGKFGFKVSIIDSRVEGAEAVKDLLSAIKSFKNKDIEVLVILRGGGPVEALQAFDNEMLTREVANFPVPVIAGIGHHKDKTLVSMAADASPSTATAAAKIISDPWEKAQFKVGSYHQEIFHSFTSWLSRSRERLNNLWQSAESGLNRVLRLFKKIEYTIKSGLSNIYHTISTKKRDLKDYIRSIIKNFGRITLARTQNRLAEIERIVSSYNPERQLNLGYSITRHNGKIVKSVRSISIGEGINTQILDGIINSEVKSIKKGEQHGKN